MLIKVKTLLQLKETLNSIKKETPRDLGRLIDIDIKEIEPLCFWDPENSTIINLEDNNNYKIVLICWKKDQVISIHNQAAKIEMTYVVQGQLTEEFFTDNTPSQRKKKHLNILKKKDISYIENEFITYRVINSTLRKTISIHIQLNHFD